MAACEADRKDSEMNALKDIAIVLAVVAACSFLTGVAAEWIYPELARMAK